MPEDDRQAVFWYRKAAEQGDAPAQNSMGFMFGHGNGVPKDARKAVSWYRKAATQGKADAQHNLGVMYALGRGVPEGDVQAYAWSNLAAAQGTKKAQELKMFLRRLMTPAQVAEVQEFSRELALQIAGEDDGSAPSTMFNGLVPLSAPSREQQQRIRERP